MVIPAVKWLGNIRMEIEFRDTRYIEMDGKVGAGGCKGDKKVGREEEELETKRGARSARQREREIVGNVGQRVGEINKFLSRPRQPLAPRR